MEKFETQLFSKADEKERLQKKVINILCVFCAVNNILNILYKNT